MRLSLTPKRTDLALNTKTLLVRTGSALVFGAIMLAAFLGPIWAFGLLMLVVHFLCIREFFMLLDRIIRIPSSVISQFIAQIAGLLFLTALLIPLLSRQSFFSIPKETTVNALPSLLSGFFIAGLLLYPALVLLRTALSRSATPVHAAVVFTSHLYITLSLSLLLIMRVASPVYPLALIACIWMNDTFAYLSGSLIGRTPLTPISPKKTWEGTLGGALLTIGVAALVSHFNPNYPYLLTIGMALCAALPGTLGDLLESRLKRLADVKDSGNIMPGHGGALDRFDSLLVAVPFAFCYLYLLGML